MNPLTQLNKNWVYETVITTLDEKPHSSPIGISTPDNEKVISNLYKTSKTYKNILKSRVFVINFVDDVEIFYNSLFEKEKLRYKEITHNNTTYYALKNAAAYIGAEVCDMRESKDIVIITSDAIFSEINKEFSESFLFNRAESLALECIIACTKINSGVDKEFFKKVIANSERVIKKVAPNSKYERIISKIVNRSPI